MGGAVIGFIFSVYKDRKNGSAHVVYRCMADASEPRQGAFVDIQALPFERLNAPATTALLRRFAEENRLGQFGVYFGDESEGRVHRLHGQE